MVVFRAIINAGHGGSDVGATAINGEYEKDINLEVVKYFKELAKPYEGKIEFIYTRLDDRYMSLGDRVRFANTKQGNIYVSVHHNASGVGATGSETIHSIHGGKGQELAELIMDEFNKLGQNKRRVFSKESNVDSNRNYFYEIRHSAMPATITEFAFLDSKDFKDIDEPSERKAEAQAILNGVLRYFDIDQVEDWKIRILDECYRMGMFKDYDYWKERLDDPIPAWAMMAMIKNMHV
jgi:N-acetylmuramoyl-L-alanine amidase